MSLLKRGAPFAAILGLGLILGSSAANATTLVGPASAAQGFDGLVVDSVTYDVTFVHDSYNNVYASRPPTFLGNTAGADDADTALIAALKNSAVTGLTGLIVPDYYSNLYLFVPSAVPNGGFVGSVGCGTDFHGICEQPVFPPPWGISTPAVDPATTYNLLDYAVFRVVTPLPATFPLFAGGLGTLGLLGWRRKRKVPA